MNNNNIFWPLNIDNNHIFNIKSKNYVKYTLGLLICIIYIYLVIYTYDNIYYSYNITLYYMNNIFKYLWYLNIENVFFKKHFYFFNYNIYTYLYDIILWNPIYISLNNLLLVKLKHNISWDYSIIHYMYNVSGLKSIYINYYYLKFLDLLRLNPVLIKYFNIIFHLMDWKRTPVYLFVYSYKYTLQFFGPVRAPFWLNFALLQDRNRLWFIDLMRPYFYWYFIYLYYKLFVNIYYFTIVTEYNYFWQDNFIFAFKDYLTMITWFLKNNYIYEFYNVRTNHEINFAGGLIKKLFGLKYLYLEFTIVLPLFFPYCHTDYLNNLFYSNFPVYFSNNTFNLWIYWFTGNIFNFLKYFFSLSIEYMYYKSILIYNLLYCIKINLSLLHFFSIYFYESFIVVKTLFLLSYDNIEFIIDYFNNILSYFKIHKIFVLRSSYFYGAWKSQYYIYFILICVVFTYITIILYRYIIELLYKDFWVILLLWSDPLRMWNIFSVNKDLDLDYITLTEIFNKNKYKDLYGLFLIFIWLFNFLVLLFIYLLLLFRIEESFALSYYNFNYTIIIIVTLLLMFIYWIYNILLNVYSYSKYSVFFDNLNFLKNLIKLNKSFYTFGYKYYWWNSNYSYNFDNSILNSLFYNKKKFKIQRNLLNDKLNTIIINKSKKTNYVSYKYVNKNFYSHYYDDGFNK